MYGVSFVKTCSYRVITVVLNLSEWRRSPRSHFSIGNTVGSRYVVISKWREHNITNFGSLY